MRVTPGELGEMAEVCGERERAREKDDWRRAALVAATVINSAGKTFRRNVKPDDLLSFTDERKRMSPEERDRRKREAAETLKLHQSKFWTKFKPESVAKLTGNNEK